MKPDIWMLTTHYKGSLEQETFGLAAEARRLRDAGGGGLVTALVPGGLPESQFSALGAAGVERILVLMGSVFGRYHGEVWSRVLEGLVRDRKPDLFLMVQNPLTDDLGPRLAASLETAFISRAVDLRLDPPAKVAGIRPVANGHLFEEIEFTGEGPCLVSFLPSVLTAPESGAVGAPEIKDVAVELPEETIRLRVAAVIESDAQSAALEDAEIIVAGGRGVGKGEAFAIVSALARALGGSVAGTRPVIDWQTLSFERQIGQTGKTVAPRLMIACGLSGANEFTAGMEKSQWVIAVNTDPRARIFGFADLGIIGDVHEILPGLIERIERERHALEK